MEDMIEESNFLSEIHKEMIIGDQKITPNGFCLKGRERKYWRFEKFEFDHF